MRAHLGVAHGVCVCLCVCVFVRCALACVRRKVNAFTSFLLHVDAVALIVVAAFIAGTLALRFGQQHTPPVALRSRYNFPLLPIVRVCVCDFHAALLCLTRLDSAVCFAYLPFNLQTRCFFFAITVSFVCGK